jgi:ABC-type transporter Mla subunit MlaD
MDVSEERDVTNAKVDTVGSILAAKMDGLMEVTRTRLDNVQQTTTRLERTMDNTTTKVVDIQQKVSIDHEHSKNVDESLRNLRINVKTLFDRTDPLEGVEKQTNGNTHRINRLERRRLMQDVLLPLGFFLSTVTAIVEAAKLFGLI